jgi:hypothetical protein
MNPRTRYIIAVCELLIVVGVVLYFFFPRTLDQALRGQFDRSQVTEIQALIVPYGENGEERRVTLTPGTDAYDDFLALLDTYHYSPYYLDTEDREEGLDAQVTITFTQDESTYTISLTGDQAIDMSGTDLSVKTYRTRGGIPFQEDILAFLLLQDYEEAANDTNTMIDIGA